MNYPETNANTSPLDTPETIEFLDSLNPWDIDRAVVNLSVQIAYHVAAITRLNEQLKSYYI